MEIWFTDEARVGQQGTLTRVWAKRGSRPRALRDRRFEWAYLFGAICPERSTGAAIIMPEVNVAAMNEHLAEISRRVPGARAGTVDKFQGQEAPIVIYSLTTSNPDEAPHGMEFLFSRHRLNVAISRARSVSILVGAPRIFEPNCRTPEQMRMANAFCAYLERSVIG